MFQERIRAAMKRCVLYFFDLAGDLNAYQSINEYSEIRQNWSKRFIFMIPKP